MKVIKVNKSATFNYELLESFVCGIVLEGKYVKRIKNGEFNFSDSYIIVDNHEVFLRNFKIGSVYDSTDLEFKLLLNRYEIDKIENSIYVKKLVAIPKSFLLTPQNRVKVEISLGKGKKIFDKKQAIKERDIAREMDREIKNVR